MHVRAGEDTRAGRRTRPQSQSRKPYGYAPVDLKEGQGRGGQIHPHESLHNSGLKDTVQAHPDFVNFACGQALSDDISNRQRRGHSASGPPVVPGDHPAGHAALRKGGGNASRLRLERVANG
jgi:hypothetical protein